MGRAAYIRIEIAQHKPIRIEQRSLVFESIQLPGNRIEASVRRTLENRRGLTRVLRSECRLDDVNDAIEQVLDGSAPAPRMVFDMAPVAAGKVATGATTVSA